ncbi:MAG: XdhC family protein [Gemmatimonadota bacterium]|nr:XdhC family protein [Gemmatimonadota bacterium]
MDEKEVMALLASLEEPAVLATIVSAKGSTPRKTGARMLIGRDGVIAGTVGGGCGEGEVITAAQDLFDGGPPTTVRVDLTDDFTSWSPAVCGGIMNVFIERANPDLFGDV